MGANPVKSRNIELFPKKLWIHNSACSQYGTKYDISFFNKRVHTGKRIIIPNGHLGGVNYYFDLPSMTSAMCIAGLNVLKDDGTGGAQGRVPVAINLLASIVDYPATTSARGFIDVDICNCTTLEVYFTVIDVTGYAFMPTKMI